MEILDIQATNEMAYEPYPTLLKKGIRSESLYFVPAVKLIIKPTKWIDCFYRLFWENNYLHAGHGGISMFSQYPKTKDVQRFGECKEFNVFEMKITLAEVFDFLYDACPPLLRKDLPTSTKSMDDILTLMKTFLMEDSQQLDMYQSIFEKITKYGYFEKPCVLDLRYMDAMRNKTPQGLLCQVVYSNTPLEKFNDSHTVSYGIFMLGMNNNSDVKLLVDLMCKHQQIYLDVCDIHRDPNAGMFIMIQYTGSMFNPIIEKSYKPFMNV